MWKATRIEKKVGGLRAIVSTNKVGRKTAFFFSVVAGKRIFATGIATSLESAKTKAVKIAKGKR